MTMKNQEISSAGLEMVEHWDRLQLKDSFSGYKPRLGVTAEAHQGWLGIYGTNSKRDLLCRNKRFSRHTKSPMKSVTLTALATERACEWSSENQLSTAMQGEQKSVFCKTNHQQGSGCYHLRLEGLGLEIWILLALGIFLADICKRILL